MSLTGINARNKTIRKRSLTSELTHIEPSKRTIMAHKATGEMKPMYENSLILVLKCLGDLLIKPVIL